VSPQLEITFEYLSKAIVVSHGGKSSSSQNSGISAQTQSQNQSPPTSPRGGTTKSNMEGLDNTLRILEFKGVGLEYPEQHLFFCKIVWATKNIQDEHVNIV
jgi:hypothetical protein